ncbi:hypothetical protein SVIOM342S_00119 [Streptomyces violaceorubidus]
MWQRPADAFVARFLGFDNVTEASVAGQAADTPWGKVPVPEDAPQGTRTVLVRPAGVRVVPADEGLRCTVTARTFRGTHVAVHLQPEDAPRLEAACALRSAPEVGAAVGVEFDAAKASGGSSSGRRRDRGCAAASPAHAHSTRRRAQSATAGATAPGDLPSGPASGRPGGDRRAAAATAPEPLPWTGAPAGGAAEPRTRGAGHGRRSPAAR